MKNNATRALMGALFQSEDGLTVQELVEKTGYSEAAIRNVLAPLVSARVVERIGHRPKTRYRLFGTALPPGANEV